MPTVSRPKLAVVFSPRSRSTHWSDGARGILESFAHWVPVDIDPTAPQGERAQQLEEALADADGLLFCGWAGEGASYLSRELLQSAPRIRFIGSNAHYRQAEFLDLKAAAEREIAICETAPLMAPWVAEYELGLCLAALRKIPQEHAVVGAGGWVSWASAAEENQQDGGLLGGRRVGLASFGAAHRRLARLLAPFETEWEAFDPYVPAEVIQEAGGRKARILVDMAGRSQVFFVGTPPTAETIGIVSRAVIEALPRGALVVVISRMSVVDQPALIERLEVGEISAAVDVYDPEPPPLDSPLRNLPNVVHTPHRAGGIVTAHRAVFRGQCEEARRFFSGEPLEYPLRGELVAQISREGSPPLDPPTSRSSTASTTT